MVRRFTQEEYEKISFEGFIKTKLTTTTNIISNNNYFMIPMKERPNLTPDLKYTISGKSITISTNRLASYIWIFRKNQNGFVSLKVSDNYFTLTANEVKTVFISEQVP